MIKQIFYLFFYYIGTFILPIVLLPVLISRLSYNVYEHMVIMQAVILSLVVVVNFGMEIIATKKLTWLYNKKKYHFSNIYINKVFNLKILVGGGVGFIFVLIYCVAQPQGMSVTSGWYSLLWIISNIFWNNWYFLSRHRAKAMMYAVLLPKFLVVPVILVLVTTDETIDKYFLCQAVASLLTVLLLNIAMCKYENIKINSFKLQHPKKSIAIASQSFSILLSQISTIVISNITTLILPIFISSKEFVIFNTSERLIRVISLLTGSVTNAVYPRSVVLAKTPTLLFYFVTKLAVVGGGGFVILVVSFYSFGGQVLDYLFPKISTEIIEIMALLLPVPLFIYLNNLFGNQIGLSLGKEKSFSKSIVLGGLTNLLFIIVLPNYFGINGAVLSVLLSQFVILTLMYFVAKNSGFYFVWSIKKY